MSHLFLWMKMNILIRWINWYSFFFLISSQNQQEEMQVALVILIIILCIFFALCSCQCYNRMKYECNEDSLYNKPHTVPVAPYYKSKGLNTVSLNQTNNLTAALMGTNNSGSEIILPFSSNYNNV